MSRPCGYLGQCDAKDCARLGACVLSHLQAKQELGMNRLPRAVAAAEAEERRKAAEEAA